MNSRLHNSILTSASRGRNMYMILWLNVSVDWVLNDTFTNSFICGVSRIRQEHLLSTTGHCPILSYSSRYGRGIIARNTTQGDNTNLSNTTFDHFDLPVNDLFGASRWRVNTFTIHIGIILVNKMWLLKTPKAYQYEPEYKGWPSCVILFYF